MTIRITNWSSATDKQRGAALERPALEMNQALRDSVRDIIRDVRNEGDAAIRELTLRLDNVEPDDISVGPAEFAAAESELSPEQHSAIDLAIRNVRLFHEAQVPARISVETMPGVHCERLSHAIDAVGLYVPAGTAPLPSTAVMLAVPAAIAGCGTRIICTPPRRDGKADSAVLVAARKAGIEDVFKIGGAQAIAAMAFGTASVPKVDKIFGPGNAWVTEAKTQVAREAYGAAIDLPAGPSEVLIIADENANAEFIAADLLSQAEHGTDSHVLLLTTSAELAQAAQDEIAIQLDTLNRKNIALESIGNSRIIVSDNLATAVNISNAYAPEHLILHLAHPREILPTIRNAGSVFVGEWSPESAGDYCSGTNHVLPTYGHARSFSGLSVEQFMRHMTVQELTKEGLQMLGGAIIELAGLEGLDAHAAAVKRRLVHMESQK